jgi:type II secretory pathway component GspD/PulD (secretin)
MRRHPQRRPGVPRSSRRVFVTFVALGCALAGGVVRAAVIVGSDGQTTKVGVTPTPPPGPMMQAARKFGRRGPEVTPAATVTPKAAATPTPTNPVVTGTAEPPGEREFNSCRKFPAGKRVVKLNMKPDTELGDLIAWISSITCKQFLLPGTIPANSKKVTVTAPRPVTIDEAYQLFLAALNAVDLTVEPTGRFLRIIETSKAKSSPMALAIDRRAPAAPVRAREPIVTRLVHVEHAQAGDAAARLAPLKGDHGDIVIASPTTLILTGEASNVDRMLEALRELDHARPE